MYGWLFDCRHLGWYVRTQADDTFWNGHYGYWFVIPFSCSQKEMFLTDSTGTILQAASFSTGQMIAGRVITVSDTSIHVEHTF